MTKISFIIDGGDLSQTDYTKISNLEKEAIKLNIEFIIFNTEYPQYVPRINSIYTIKNRNTSLIDAVIASKGKWVIFAKINTILDNLERLVKLTTHKEALAICTKKSPNIIERLIGLRDISNTKFICLNRDFLISILPSHNPEFRALKKSSQQHSLKLLPNNYLHNDSDRYFSKYTILWRPVISRINRRFDKYLQKLKCVINESFDFVVQKITLSYVLLITPKVSWDPQIPVFIICRDRVEPLKKLVNWIEEEGLKNIIFIDNASTYKPLLEYLTSTNYRVVWLRKNIGHSSPWSEHITNIYAKGKPFIVTDPDVIPVEGSHGAVKYFINLLNKYPEYSKVGFGLKIDDLPNYYELKKSVITWESQFWKEELSKNVYKADLDTTFALYRRNTPQTLRPALRTGGKYLARHEPWYINSKNIPEEVKYYRKHANKDIGTWGTDNDSLLDMYANHQKKVTNKPKTTQY